MSSRRGRGRRWRLRNGKRLLSPLSISQNRLLDHGEKLGLVKGLGDEVEGPPLQGRDGGFHRTVSRDQNHRQRGKALLAQIQHLHAVGPRHVEIGDHQIRLFSPSMKESASTLSLKAVTW